ncbi:MFS transporter [Anaerotalea alkaliphila]|uniref:MFS transporter n=1 Tax=Anaerotalea alkaliphila TaxID=2662126 RepID=A0A7X5KMF1_9FIRM|nr:MFS transporter [Anaerotalea alkaliphila]NDL67744.1 MFS transporter [Anaerotalea alkaliphila]
MSLFAWKDRFAGEDSEERSRRFFVLEGITGITHLSLTSGAFLAGFVSMLGGSEQINGFIGVIPAIAAFFQLFSSLIYEGSAHRKRAIFRTALIYRILIAGLYLLPVALLPLGISLPVFMAMYMGAYAMNGLLAPAVSDWMVRLTPMAIRGQYFAGRERLAMLVSAVLTILLGFVLDHAKAGPRPAAGFLVVGGVLGVLSLLNLYSLKNVSEVDRGDAVRKYTLREVVSTPLASPNFRRMMVLFALWNLGLQVGAPFIPVYMVTRLDLSYTYMMVLTVVGTVARVSVTNMWGRLADRKSWFLAAKLSMGLLALVHFGWGFVNPGNQAVLAPLLFTANGFVWGGIGISIFNLQFLFAKSQGRILYLGTNAAVGGLFSLLSVQAGAWITKLLEGREVALLGLRFNNLQAVFLLSGLLLALCPLFITFFLETKAGEVERD